MPGFPDDLVVETRGRCDADGIRPAAACAGLPAHLRGLVEALGEYQQLAADAAWSGTRRDGVRALAAHPLVLALHRPERVYDEMARAHRDHLPERLLPVYLLFVGVDGGIRRRSRSSRRGRAHPGMRARDCSDVYSDRCPSRAAVSEVAHRGVGAIAAGGRRRPACVA